MFIEVPSVHNESKSKSKVLNDVASRTRDWRRMMVGSSITTSAHEVAHQVHADMRNDRIRASYQGENPDRYTLWEPDPTYQRPYTGPGDNGFYMLNGKGFKCKGPQIRKSQVANFIPQELRGFRFRTYITGQTSWDDTPLYIYDEWAAYIIGSTCAIELAEMGDTSPKNTDISSGPIEFMMYSLGVVLAAQKHDPDFFSKEDKFMDFVNEMAQNALTVGRKCNEIFPWDATSKYLDLWEGPVCKPLRDVLNIKKPDLTVEDFEQA